MCGGHSRSLLPVGFCSSAHSFLVFTTWHGGTFSCPPNWALRSSEMGIRVCFGSSCSYSEKLSLAWVLSMCPFAPAGAPCRVTTFSVHFLGFLPLRLRDLHQKPLPIAHMIACISIHAHEHTLPTYFTHTPIDAHLRTPTFVDPQTTHLSTPTNCLPTPTNRPPTPTSRPPP